MQFVLQEVHRAIGHRLIEIDNAWMVGLALEDAESMKF